VRNYQESGYNYLDVHFVNECCAAEVGEDGASSWLQKCDTNGSGAHLALDTKLIFLSSSVIPRF